MDFLQLAKDRYSCRKFSGKRVEAEKIEKMIEAGLHYKSREKEELVKYL